mgnify:CR=1 FL=1
MIVREKPNSFQLFFVIHGSVVPKIFPKIVFFMLVGAAVTTAHYHYPALFERVTFAPLLLLGVALSLFLGFRNNACYDRWWEARKQWGQLLADSRSLSRQVISFIDERSEGGADMQKRMVYLSIAFNHALRHELRQTDPWQDIEKYLAANDVEKLRQVQNLPDAIIRMMGRELGHCRHKSLLSDFLVQSLDDHINSMVKVQAACERIKNTPLPFAYSLLVRRTAYLYCFILPFGIVVALGSITPLFCGIIAYAFFGFDALSEQLEKPFSLSANGLALNAMSRMLEINLLDSLGETDLPEPIKAINHCLQ